LLTLIAEASATFVGFSLVIGLLQPDQPNAGVRLNSMRGVAELAIIAGAGAFLALVLDAFGLSSETVWRFASATLGTGWAVAHFFASHRFRKAGTRMTRSPTLLVVVLLAYSGILLLAWNTIAPGASSGARYSAALVFALSASAFLFVRATFEHPGKPAA
jgi:hypothetical protein